MRPGASELLDPGAGAILVFLSGDPAIGVCEGEGHEVDPNLVGSAIPGKADDESPILRGHRAPDWHSGQQRRHRRPRTDRGSPLDVFRQIREANFFGRLHRKAEIADYLNNPG